MTTTNGVNIKLQYKTERRLIGLHDLNKFMRVNTARDVRTGKITKLTNVLDNGRPHAGVWLVNQRGSKMRMIDCNHRHASLTSYLTRKPDNKVEIELHVFSNLTDEEERDEFYRANSTTNQTTSDFLKMYSDDINIWKIINTKFPLKIHHTNTNTKMGLHALLFPYLTRLDIPYAGGYNGSAIDFINILRTWNSGKKNINSDGFDTYNTMNEFLKDYINLFGTYHSKNDYWKAPVFMPLFRIWYENKTHLTSTQLFDALKKMKSGAGVERVQYWRGMGAPRGNCEKAIKDYLQVINGTKVNNRLFFTTKNSNRDVVKISGV